MNPTCTKCSAPLTETDIAFYKKLVNRGANSFMCKKCTSEHFQITLERADELIEHFRRSGCTLFPPVYESAEKKRE